MKKIFILLVFVCIQFIANAQSFKEMEFTFDGKGRPAIEREFRASDNSHSLIYYSNATVSFFNDLKYTDMFVVHNAVGPDRMTIVKSDGEYGETLLYVKQTKSYINKTTGVEYKLVENSINTRKSSK